MAIEKKLQAVELDVWLTKDKELIVLHGGDSGEINFGSLGADDTLMSSIKEKYVYELSLEDNRKLEPKFVMPTLEEVIAFIDKRALINIELKVPHLEESRINYSWPEAAKSVYKLLQKTDMGPNCFISSFNHDVLRLIE